MRFILRNKKLNFFSHLAFLIFSFYISFVIFLGGCLGYIAAKHISRKAYYGSMFKKGKIRMVRLKFKNYQLHFHHWMQACLGLILYFIFFETGNYFVISFFGGVIAEDFLCDKNFYSIFEKTNF